MNGAAAVDLRVSLHVLSYSMAAPSAGGVGKQEVERGEPRQDTTPQGLKKRENIAACMGNLEKKLNNLLYTALS